jgi:hypothetical protein
MTQHIQATHEPSREKFLPCYARTICDVSRARDHECDAECEKTGDYAHFLKYERGARRKLGGNADSRDIKAPYVADKNF